MADRYDAIVIGCGGVGSATLQQLASRGLRVLGLEQFSLGHALGSSHGQTRIIRQAYFEHPNYVPLLFEAYDRWAELESETGVSLYKRTGLLEVGRPGGELVEGIRQSVAEHNLRVEEYEAGEARIRFPGFRIDDDQIAIFEYDAGYLRVESCVLAQLALAKAHGAIIVEQSPLKSWRRIEGGCCVTTAGASYEANTLIFTAGAWSNSLISNVDQTKPPLPIRVLKKHVHWYQPTTNAYDVVDANPIFYFETDDGHFYGFPTLDERGLKIAEHSGGEIVENPTLTTRDVDSTDRSRVERFLNDRLTASAFKANEHSVCFYSMTPDGHFVLDQIGDEGSVFVAAGFSGHGFKFTRILGKLLADIVCDNRWDERINFLRSSRFSESGE